MRFSRKIWLVFAALLFLGLQTLQRSQILFPPDWKLPCKKVPDVTGGVFVGQSFLRLSNFTRQPFQTIPSD
jgi:hypothetical protein